MAPGRNSGVMTGFILSGFSEHPELKIVLFVLFLGIFFTALAWTPALIILTSMESHLHSPKYFFLGNLSFVHISYASSIVPKTLCDFFKEQKTVSCVGCAAQFFFFSGMGGSVVSWQLWHKTNTLQPSALHSPHGPHPPTLEDSSLDWSKLALYSGSTSVGPRVINHFFCDLPPLLVLSCSNTFLSQVVNVLVVCAVGGTSALLVLVSYGYVIAAVMKIPSTQGRTKTFKTCASHLSAVILFYGSGLFSYLALVLAPHWTKIRCCLCSTEL